MRTLLSTLIAGIALVGLSSTASATAVIDIEWAGGLETLSVSSSAESSNVTALIYIELTNSAAVNFFFTVGYDNELNDLLDIVSSTECGTAVDPLVNPATCGANSTGTEMFGFTGAHISAGTGETFSESTGGSGGQQGIFEANGGNPPIPSPANGRFFVGSIVFHVTANTGSTLVNAFFGPGDIITATDGSTPIPTTFDGATFIHGGAVPEPGTVALVGMGLLGLAVAGGRRR